MLIPLSSAIGGVLPTGVKAEVVKAPSFATFSTSAIRARADEEFVGILALAIEPATARDLGLTEEVKTKLSELVQQREDEVFDLAMSIKDLTDDQRRERLRPFVEESERLGFELLSETQIAKLQKTALRRKGVAALVESDIQKELELTGEQNRKIEKLVTDRANISGSQRAQIQGRSQIDGEIAQLLSEEQREEFTKITGTTLRLPRESERTGRSFQGGSRSRQFGDRRENPEISGGAIPLIDLGRQSQDVAAGGANEKLKFSFRYTPWKQVLDWFAQQADLSLVAEPMPPGTFNYIDENEYTPEEALDLINGELLTQGYTLVRKHKILRVIDLSQEGGIDPNVLEDVAPEDLGKKGKNEIVRSTFDIRTMSPEEAEIEITALLGPQGSLDLMPTAKKVRVTETAGNLLTIHRLIAGVSNPTVATFQLEHLKPAKFLKTARQLLGMGVGQNSDNDGTLHIAVGQENRLFVSGTAERVEHLKKIIAQVDTQHGQSASSGKESFVVYPITSDPELTYQVLQSLLADKHDEVRMSLDAGGGNFYLYGSEEAHELVTETLGKMQNDGREIVVMPLRRVDPQTALTMVTSLLQIGEENTNAPIVDINPVSRQLIVRGSQRQVDEIRGMLVQMGEDPDGGAASGSRVRTIPLPEEVARQAMEQAEALWPSIRRNKIRVKIPSRGSGIQQHDLNKEKESGGPLTLENLQEGFKELNLPNGDQSTLFLPKEVKKNEASSGTTSLNTSSTDMPLAGATLPLGVAFSIDDSIALQDRVNTQDDRKRTQDLPEIEVVIGPNGLVIASEDLDALDAFENLFRDIAGSIDINTERPDVYFLKYIRANDAANLLNQIVNGEDSSGGSDDMLTNLASSFGGQFGGLISGVLGSGGTSGNVRIVPDTALNSLFVIANPQDRLLVEDLLEIIDQEGSPIEVRTERKPQLIPVYNVSADEIADNIRTMYAARLNSGQQNNGQQNGRGGRGGGGGGGEAAFLQAMMGGGGRSRGGGNGNSNNANNFGTSLPLITIGVDQRSNSLIVAASEQDFNDIQSLVESLDKAADESADISLFIPLKNSNPDVVQQALTAMLGDRVQTGSNNNRGGNNARGNNRGNNRSGNNARGNNRGNNRSGNNARGNNRGNNRGGGNNTGGRGGGGGGRGGGRG